MDQSPFLFHFDTFPVLQLVSPFADAFLLVVIPPGFGWTLLCSFSFDWNTFPVNHFESEVASASSFSVVSVHVPMSIFRAFFTVLSIESGVTINTVASSSCGESFVLSTVWDTFPVNHLESEVANTGSFSVVSVHIPMSVLGAFFAISSVESGESIVTITSSSWGWSFILSAIIISLMRIMWLIVIMRLIVIMWLVVIMWFVWIMWFWIRFVTIMRFVGIMRLMWILVIIMRSVGIMGLIWILVIIRLVSIILAGVGVGIIPLSIVAFADFVLAAVSAIRWAS